jgi:hypothetical protein
MTILSAKDVAERLNKPVAWVHAHGRQLGGAKIGRYWFFTEENFQDAIQGQGRKNLERANLLRGGARVGTRQAQTIKSRGKSSGADETDRHHIGWFD